MANWPTLEDYKAFARIEDQEDDALILQALEAVQVNVEERIGPHAYLGGLPGGDIKSDVAYAVLLWTNRLVKRRNSPEGVVGTSLDGIVADIGRTDPDVNRLIERYVEAGIA